MDDYHSWYWYCIVIVYIILSIYNLIKENRKEKELVDNDFPSDLIVCRNGKGEQWLYRKKNGQPLPAPKRILNTNLNERWLYHYGKKRKEVLK